jgi:uncharacterized protein with HEPN domain
MAEAANFAEEISHKQSGNAEQIDPMSLGAVCWQLMVVTEAARQMPTSDRRMLCELPWSWIADLRAKLDEPFQLEWSYVRAVIRHDLPPLKAQLQAMLDEEPPSGGHET